MSITDKLLTIQTIKENIKNSINNKGGNVGDDFTQYSSAIDNISAGGISKIDVGKYGIKLSESTFNEVPDFYDFSNVIDFNLMFANCGNLQTIPFFDSSKITKMEKAFYFCDELQTIPYLNTENVTSMSQLFWGCSNLQTIPQLITKNVRSMFGIFSDCKKLNNVPPLNAENLNIPSYQGLIMNTELPNLTDFGGLIGLKYSLIGDYNFYKLPNLNYQSCINILNGLYNFTENGETPTSNQGQLRVHPNFLTAVGDEINIATSKGWTIQV